MSANESTEPRTEKEGLVIERIFAAPRELVWRAWTEPEHFARWYGPEGFSVPVCEIDFRVGGRHLFGMSAPNGHRMFTTGVYREIVPPERFVVTDAFADEQGNLVPMGDDGPVETILTVTLEDVGDGRTKLTLQQTGWPDDSMAEGAGGGWNQAFDKLDAELANA